MSMSSSKKSFINGGGYQWYNKSDPDGGSQTAVFNHNASVATKKKRIIAAVALGVALIVSVAVGVSVSSPPTSKSEGDGDPGVGDPGVGDPKSTDPPLTSRQCQDGLTLYLPYAAQIAGGNDQLTRISCSSADMASSIPAAIGLYTELTHIGMSNTGTTGTLPFELGLLSKLVDLTLSDNPDLEGTLPDELGNLSALTRLNVDNNIKMLGDLPAGLRALYDQKKLTFSSEGSGMSTMSPTTSAPTAPTTAPTSTPTAPTSTPTSTPTRLAIPSSTPSKMPTTKRPSKMPSVEPTKRPTNAPSVLPTRTPTKTPSKAPTNAPSKQPTTSIPTLAPVDCTENFNEYLRVEANNAGGIDQFTELEICEGGEITANIGLYTGLTSLRVGNPIGTLPAEIGLLTNLEELYISCHSVHYYAFYYNEYAHIPHFCESKNWGSEGIGKATGTLPSSWSNLRALKILHITAQGGLTGSLPPQWSSMTSLKQLTVIRNQHINGTFPSEWSSMTSLETLHITAGKFTGGLPSEWSGMAALKNVVIQGNTKLEGVLPSSWGNLQALEILDLGAYSCYFVQYHGTGDCFRQNKQINVGNEQLGGEEPLPTEWANLDSLKYFSAVGLGYVTNKEDSFPDLENIPRAWGKLTNLEKAEFGQIGSSKTYMLGKSHPFVTKEFSALAYPIGKLQIIWTKWDNVPIFDRFEDEGKRKSCGHGLDEWLRYFIYRTGVSISKIDRGVGVSVWRAVGLENRDDNMRNKINEMLNPATRPPWFFQSDEDATLNTEPVQAEPNIGRLRSPLPVGGDWADQLLSISCFNMDPAQNDKLYFQSTADFTGDLYSARTIPTELARLPMLQQIDFFAQDLKGTLPTELGLLTHLGQMSFGGVGLEGQIPTQWASLTKLTQLFLVQTKIDDTALPDWLNQRVASGDLDFEMLE